MKISIIIVQPQSAQKKLIIMLHHTRWYRGFSYAEYSNYLKIVSLGTGLTNKIQAIAHIHPVVSSGIEFDESGHTVSFSLSSTLGPRAQIILYEVTPTYKQLS